MEVQRLPMEDLMELIRLQLSNGGRANLTVTGISMLPMLHNRRDSVVLTPVSQPPKKGDIILYRRENGQFILHRIIRKDGLTDYICSGDNQWQPEQVAADQILAVVDGFRRNGKDYSCGHFGYRVYIWAWVGIFPLRRYVFALRRRLGRIKRKLFPKK